MKDWRKHKFGFVNFDDTHLYFTSTGNWSDTKDLGEYNQESTRKSSSSEKYKSITYFGFAGILLTLLLWKVGFKGFTYSAITGLAWLGYSGYHYMSTGLTGEFMIPYVKVSNIELSSTTAKITFLDFNENESE